MTSRKRFTDDGLPDHLLRWLDATTRRVSAELAAAGGSEPGVPRASHRRLLQMISPEGTRVTDLAIRAGMTKQATGEMVDSLERAGLAKSERDPHDGRVRLVRRTPLGQRASDEAAEMIAGVEAGLRRQVGARRYDDALQVLRELGGNKPGE